MKNVSTAVKFLEDAFEALNNRFFANELEKPMITIQSTPKVYGHFTTYDAWALQDGSEHIGRKEINIGAETLDRPIANIIATLVHEMVHYWCLLNGVQDTSRGGTYHNKKFKNAAEEHAILIEYDKRIGWSVTQPSETLIAFVHDQGWNGINFSRNGGVAEAKPKKKSSTRKYTCPICGQSVRATKTVNIICGDCMCAMEAEEDDED